MNRQKTVVFFLFTIANFLFTIHIFICLYVIVTIMSIKDKVMNMVTTHPKLVTFAIGFAVTFTIGTIIGMLDHNQAFANGGHKSSNNGGG